MVGLQRRAFRPFVRTGGTNENRFVILLCSAACLSVSGSIYIWSVFNIPLAEAHNWEIGQVAFAYSLFLLVSTVSFILAGSLLRRIPPRVMMLAAGIGVVVGWFIAGSAQTIPMLYLGFGIIAGFADGFVYNAALSTAQAWFPDRRGFASGVCLGAVGLVPMIFAPLGNFLIERFNVSMSFYICAALFLCIFLLFAPHLRFPEEGWTPVGWTPDKSEVISSPVNLPTRTVLRQPLFWLMWVMMLTATSTGLMLSGHTSNIGQQMVGITASEAALQVSFLALASFLGRVCFGTLSDKIGRCLTVGILMGVTALDLLVGFRLVDNFASFSAVLCIAGACFGGVMAVMPALCADVFGATYFGQNYAWLYSGYTCASLLGPTLAVQSLAQTGAYQMAFTLSGVIAILAIFLSVIVWKNSTRFIQRMSKTA